MKSCDAEIKDKLTENQRENSNEKATNILDLDSDILKYKIPEFMDNSSIASLAQTNKHVCQLFQPILLSRRSLKNFIERSEREQVVVFLKQHPSLVLNACQSALVLGDVNMCKAITQGREEILRQIDLPEKIVDEKNTYDFQFIIEAIKSGKNMEDIMAKFRKDLDKIKKEKGFPLQAILDAFEIYWQLVHISSWTRGQCLLFTINVIGYLQRLSPAWLKKAFVTGLHKVVKKPEESRDDFIIENMPGVFISIDPTTDVPGLGLGFNFCVNIFGKATEVNCIDTCYILLLEYLEQMQISLDLLRSEKRVQLHSSL